MAVSFSTKHLLEVIEIRHFRVRIQSNCPDPFFADWIDDIVGPMPHLDTKVFEASWPLGCLAGAHLQFGVDEIPLDEQFAGGDGQER
jgi:hypothetical protein